MRSPRPAFLWLLYKEWRELLFSRAWWLFLVLMGPLVGVSFVNAVRTYAEASGLNGAGAGAGEAFSPLIGIWAPISSACEVAAAFLLPFVVIRLVAGDRQSGALKLESQHSLTSLSRMAAKCLVLFTAWLTALLAPAIAVGLWRSYGGNVYWPELSSVILGQLLNAGLTIALAGAAASITEHPATAAILTLMITVGSWIISFIAAVNGGLWERIAGYTPTAMMAQFQHGLVRLDVVLIALTLIVAGLVLSAVWMQLGVALRQRVYASIALAAVTAAAIFLCSLSNASSDLSENRMNSFPVSDEQALRRIHPSLSIEAHLAPEDPRRFDLESKSISKLRRVMPGLKVRYISSTSIGLFEQANPHYGEIWYDLDGHRSMSRATTPENVLETIYSLAGVTPPDEPDSGFRGHPLAVAPKGAAFIFYVIWPLLALTSGFILKRRLS